MDIVKKNLVSILCGVIALVCVILIFFPLGGMYASLEADVKKSKKVGDDLAAVKNQPRHWPTLSLKEEDKVPLKEFPTEALNKVGEGITEGWKATTNNIYNATVARQDAALKPLVPGLLPRSNGLALRLQFNSDYAKLFGIDPNAVPAGGAAPAGGGFGGGGFGGGGFGGGGFGGAQPHPTGTTAVSGPPKPLLGTGLVGRTPPTADEIKLKQDEVEARIRTEKTIVVNGQPMNQPQVDEAVAKARAAVADQLGDQFARGSIVYADPTIAFFQQPGIGGPNPPSDEDIFLAQVGLWLQQEICRGIYDVNRPAIEAHKNDKNGAQGVLVAPIKHLVGIRFTLPFALPAPLPAGTPAPTDEPKLPDPRPAAKVAVDFVKNPLGQVSNDMYDVLPFTLVMVCEADTLPQTLATMTYNRYMTIRAVDVQSVDAAVSQAGRLLYGSKPVVQVSVRGQYIMLRSFSGKYMPPNIIRGILTPPAAPGAVGG